MSIIGSKLSHELFNGLKSGSRLSLAKAITLVESRAARHKKDAQELMDLVAKSQMADIQSYLQHQHQEKEKEKKMHHPAVPSSPPPPAAAAANLQEPSTILTSLSSPLPPSSSLSFRVPTIRVGLSGPPGVGKSTFIEALGTHIIKNENKRVAVLAVDPSSVRSGGSILGDKTRMIKLTKDEKAYVRASPSGGSLGGVARNTHEAALICEAAGYDVILIETVGVGQSETMVSDMVDVFTLLIPPAGGDELQGLKKGIVELVDLVIVNKADGDMINAARRAQMEYTSALKLLRPKNGPSGWQPQVIAISSVNHTGVAEAWKQITTCHRSLLNCGILLENRMHQRKRWLWRILSDNLVQRLMDDEAIRKLIEKLEEQVSVGIKSPGQAADEVIETFLHNTANPNQPMLN